MLNNLWNESFVFTFRVLLVENAILLIQEVYRVLRPRGLVLSRQPNAGSLLSRDAYYSDYTHKWFHSSRGLSYLFSAAKFGKIKALPVYPEGPGVKAIAALVLKIYFGVHKMFFLLENGVNARPIFTKNFIIMASKV